MTGRFHVIRTRQGDDYHGTFFMSRTFSASLISFEGKRLELRELNVYIHACGKDWHN